MAVGADRDAALDAFEAHRRAFEDAIRRAPDAALRYRPAGEDYALGGLVVHVAQVLRHYTEVLSAAQAAGWQPLAAPATPLTDAESAAIREGFDGSARAAVVNDLRSSHIRLVELLRVGDADAFGRQADITYNGAAAPHPTSAADILGWVDDHYTEHIDQIGELITAWAASTR